MVEFFLLTLMIPFEIDHYSSNFPLTSIIHFIIISDLKEELTLCVAMD